MALYSTLWANGIGEDVHILRRDCMKRWDIARILLNTREGDAVLLNGALGFEDLWIDLLYGIAIRIRRRRVKLIISDATWHSRSVRKEARVPFLHSIIEKWNKLLILALSNRDTEVCFLSRDEASEFAAISKLGGDKVHFTEFCFTIWPDELGFYENQAESPGEEEPYFFSGGNSSRDYTLLAEAAKGTGLKFRIATRQKLAWPSEIVASPVSHTEFLTLMARSRAVVLMMDSETRRSVGQQTFLNAMALGKPVIVNDVAGVRDYIEDGVNGIIVPPRCPASLRSALEWVADKSNADKLEAMAARAKAYALLRSPKIYFSNLDKILRNAAERLGREIAPAATLSASSNG